MRALLLVLLIFSFILPADGQGVPDPAKQYLDIPFLQDYSVKYYKAEGQGNLLSVFSDRNGVIQVLSSDGLLKLRGGHFLHPGTFVKDRTYRTSVEKNIAGMGVYQGQLVYLDDEATLSHGWAGKLFYKHQLRSGYLLAGGADFSFLISDGQRLQYLKEGQIVWEQQLNGSAVLDLKYDTSHQLFWILSGEALWRFSPSSNTLESVLQGKGMTAMHPLKNGSGVILGSIEGYVVIDPATGQQKGMIHQKLPVRHITSIAEIDGRLWFGSTRGAFAARVGGGYDYYFGERWLPGQRVVHIAAGPGGSVLILTDQGLGHIQLKEMTLRDKAAFYEQQVRKRHIRLGFNATLSGMDHGDIATGYLSDSDNDGLWTAMYLGGEAFRYAVTGSREALDNCRASLEAMERLYTINPVPGFPSRSFERSGYISDLADPHRWQNAEDPEWDWKATTSSDEAIGHIFAFGVIAELVEDRELKEKAVRLIDELMQHIVNHDLYLIDYDGKPTQWGKWHPDYVNARPKMVGDRKLNSSNIIGMLQTAYHFTGKEIYKTTAFDLMDNHGYLENLLRPISEIGEAPESADALSRNLSEGWNHSDDEMYFLGYWGLYRYAFNEELKAKYKAAIIDHWEAERPEKEGAWNIFTALTGADHFDLAEAAWYLREYPLDLITWTVENSHRSDIEKLPPNFRQQFTKKVLPPDELPIARHNANRFRLDGGNDGRSEYSAGDIWILPYWMGRYLGVISPPYSREE